MGLGWDGWDGNARTTSGGPGLGQLLSPPSAAGGLERGAAAAGQSWEHSRAAAAPPSRLPRLGEKFCKKKILFCPWLGVSALILAQEPWGFPCRGSGRCSLISGVAFIQVGVELEQERGSQKLWNLQNSFHHFKIQALPGLPARPRRPGPSPSPSRGFLPLQGLWGERGISGAALSPV